MAKKRQGLKDKERRTYALRMAIQLGCSGAHKMPDGSWAPCSSHEELVRLSNAAESSGWINDNSLNSLRRRDRRARELRAKKSLFSVVSGKTAIPMAAPRDNDPDVFVDPDSARLRSRQLGCIGISRRISKSGRTIWMPCTNMSDYARLSRTTALGRRGANMAQERQIRGVVQRELRRGQRKR